MMLQRFESISELKKVKLCFVRVFYTVNRISSGTFITIYLIKSNVSFANGKMVHLVNARVINRLGNQQI